MLDIICYAGFVGVNILFRLQYVVLIYH